MAQDEAPNFEPALLEAAGALGGAPDEGYVWPTSQPVLDNLKAWQKLKFGVIIHWGIYSAIGQGGSWSLHRDDLGWFTDPPEDWQGSASEYQDWYYEQARTFTGHEFDAKDWARSCADAGMKYCVFTTKHHDGFCMYDSHFTNLKSTAENSGLRRDILQEVNDAFKAEGLDMGAYFSLADWSRSDYWDRSLPIHDRFHNYDISQRPKTWQQFCDFTKNQLEEIITRYGPFRLAWLDAGWVREPHEPIGMKEIAQTLRGHDPSLMIVHRETHGEFEDYRTPEQEIPDDVLDYPWESCMTLTREWCAMEREEASKPTLEVIGNLIKIVSRGGNYLLGIGPDATGHMPESVRRGLKEIGEWVGACGEGIYESHVVQDAPTITSDSELEWFCTEKDGVLYAFGLATQDDVPGGTITFDQPVQSVSILGGSELTVEQDGERSVVHYSASPTKYAIGLKIQR